MSSVFDGMAGVLNQVFGAPVMFYPPGRVGTAIQSVFREEPIAVTGDDGRDVLIDAPTWRVPRDVLAEVPQGSQIVLADGRTFNILNQIGSGSPAVDAFRVYELELVA